jgi:carboxylesterase
MQQRVTAEIMAGAEPLRLDGDADRRMLLLHGFNDTPQSVAPLARSLHERGWTVHVPLLPGHGRGDAAAARSSAAEWIDAARAEWRGMNREAGITVLAGQSMGGALAVILASEAAPAMLVLVAPYLSMGRLPRMLARIWPLWSVVSPWLRSDPARSIRDPDARARSLGNARFTPRMVAELLRVVVRARRALAGIRVPCLVLHARRDYRIPDSSAARAFAEIGSPDKTLVWRDGTGHVLAVDHGHDEVARIVGEWLDARVRTSSPGRDVTAVVQD